MINNDLENTIDERSLSDLASEFPYFFMKLSESCPPYNWDGVFAIDSTLNPTIALRQFFAIHGYFWEITKMIPLKLQGHKIKINSLNKNTVIASNAIRLKVLKNNTEVVYDKTGDLTVYLPALELTISMIDKELADQDLELTISASNEESHDTKLISGVDKTEYDENWALQQAVVAAKKSNCQSKRGVVIWHRTLGLVSFGWNAPPEPHKCDGSDECKLNCSKTAIHAEQAAIIDMLRSGSNVKPEECEMLHVKIVDGEAVISEKPSCWQCSKLILGVGLNSMWLYQKEGLVKYSAEEFHNQTLKNCGLFVYEEKTIQFIEITGIGKIELTDHVSVKLNECQGVIKFVTDIEHRNAFSDWVIKSNYDADGKTDKDILLFDTNDVCVCQLKGCRPMWVDFHSSIILIFQISYKNHESI